MLPGRVALVDGEVEEGAAEEEEQEDGGYGDVEGDGRDAAENGGLGEVGRA